MRNVRFNIVVLILLLLCTGIVMIYSASGIYAYEKFGDSSFFLKRHLIYLSFGVIMAFIVMYFDYRRLRRYSRPLIIFTILLLICLFPFGKEIGGVKRWFKFGLLSFQPSEFAKLALVIYLADFLSRRQSRLADFRRGFLPPAIVTGLIALLILAQPDFGCALTILLLGSILFCTAGIQLRYILSTFLLSIPIISLAVITAPYRWRRIVAFINPWADPQGSGFQLIQSYLALGSGGIFGVGLGKSQQKLLYLPAAQTDFIFSIIGEELGLIGTGVVVILFLLFMWQGLKVAYTSDDLFGRFLALGIVSIITIQVIINIGVSTGSIPTKGLPLPFISYGGTSLVFNLIGVGLLLNISRSSSFKKGLYYNHSA